MYVQGSFCATSLFFFGRKVKGKKLFACPRAGLQLAPLRVSPAFDFDKTGLAHLSGVV